MSIGRLLLADLTAEQPLWMAVAKAGLALLLCWFLAVALCGWADLLTGKAGA